MRENWEGKWKEEKKSERERNFLPLSLFILFSVFFSVDYLYDFPHEEKICAESQSLPLGSKDSIFAWEVMILQFTIVFFYLKHRKNWTK